MKNRGEHKSQQGAKIEAPNSPAVKPGGQHTPDQPNRGAGAMDEGDIHRGINPERPGISNHSSAEEQQRQQRVAPVGEQRQRPKVVPIRGGAVGGSRSSRQTEDAMRDAELIGAPQDEEAASDTSRSEPLPSEAEERSAPRGDRHRTG